MSGAGLVAVAVSLTVFVYLPYRLIRLALRKRQGPEVEANTARLLRGIGCVLLVLSGLGIMLSGAVETDTAGSEPRESPPAVLGAAMAVVGVVPIVAARRRRRVAERRKERGPVFRDLASGSPEPPHGPPLGRS